MELTKHLILHCAYADNYSGSFKNKEMYLQVKADMVEVHEKIGLPLKCTYTSVNTDDKILTELNIGADDEATYNFLGLVWDMRTNTLTPNSYFALEKRKAGLKSGSLNECVENENSFFEEIKVTRRLLSRLCAQSYDRLGIFMSCITTGLKILTSRSCELVSITEMDVDLKEKDADFVKVVRNFLKNLKLVHSILPYLNGFAAPRKR